MFWLGAGALAGATVVGLNPTRGAHDLAADIRHADCAMIVTDAAGADRLRTLDHGVDAENIWCIDDARYQLDVDEHRGAAAVAAPGVDAATLLLLLFTSGTTGNVEGSPVHTGSAGPHRVHGNGEVRASPRRCRLLLHATVSRQRAHGALGARPGERSDGLPHTIVLRLRFSARCAVLRRHVLHLCRQGAGLPAGHPELPTTPTTRCSGASAPRPHRKTRSSSAAASAPNCSKATGPARAAPWPHPIRRRRRAHWGGPRTTMSSSSTRIHYSPVHQHFSTTPAGSAMPTRRSARSSTGAARVISRATTATMPPRRAHPQRLVLVGRPRLHRHRRVPVLRGAARRLDSCRRREHLGADHRTCTAPTPRRHRRGGVRRAGSALGRSGDGSGGGGRSGRVRRRWFAQFLGEHEIWAPKAHPGCCGCPPICP